MLVRVLIILAVCIISRPLYAQDNVQTRVQEAEEKYREGRLDEAIDLAAAALGKPGLSKEERGQAYKILGKAYFAKQLVNDARAAIRILLNLIPAWRPDPNQDPPAFHALAEEVIKELEQQRSTPKPLPSATPSRAKARAQTRAQKPHNNKTWLWIGGGALAVGVTAYFVFNADDNGEEMLPTPPSLPQRP